MKRLHFISICVWAFSITMFSQPQVGNFTPRDYSIVPPAPQVASFFEAKDYPVDYFRGVPQIEFPLYVIKCGQIEVPITLSYNGGGIKTNQAVGNAGLGWTLNCNAMISHTIYGAPDDARGNLHGLWHLDNDETEFRNRLTTKIADYDPIDGRGYKESRSWQAILGKRYYQGRTDVANDLFSLYGLGLSATFAMFKDGKIVKSSAQPLNIEKTSIFEQITDGGYDCYGFRVTTANGLKYQFGVQDRTRYDYYHGVPELEQREDSLYYCSSWHLTNIQDNAGNVVNFSYIPNGCVIRDSSNPMCYGYSNKDLASMVPERTHGVSSVIYSPKILNQISYDGINISFKYFHLASGNSDALLEEIKITPNVGEERIIRFHYQGKHLESIIDQNKIIYRFSYYEDAGGNGSDFGGYHNGGNNQKIPTVETGGGAIGNGADRSVDPMYSTDESLRRIDYATGGYTEFIWESNTFSHVNDAPYYGRLSDQIHITKVKTDTLRACNEPGYAKLELNGWRLPEGQCAEIDMTKYFNMNPANLFGTDYYSSHKYDVYTEINPPIYPHVIIRDHNTRKVEKVYFLDSQTIEPEGEKKATPLTLEPGVYDFELKYPDKVLGAEYFLENEFRYHDGISGYIFIKTIWTDAHTSRGHENWCGLRIKRIISSSGDDNEDVIRKDFYYNRAGDPNATSGTVQILPKYDYMHYKDLSCQDGVGYESSEVYCVGAQAFPQTPCGSFSSIEYPVVSTCLGLEDPMEPDSYLHYFWQTNYYSSSQDATINDYINAQFKEYQPIGARMYTSVAHRRGDLTRTIYNVGTPGVTKEFSYNIYESDDTPLLTTDAFTVCDFTMSPGYNGYGTYDYSIGKYTIIPYNKTINYEGSFSIDGLDSYKRYEYFYNSYTDALDWNLPKCITSSDSEHGTSEVRYTYLKGQNGYTPLPETEIVVRGGSVISATRTEYDRFTYLPVRKYTLSESVQPSEIISDNQQTTSSQLSKINKPTYEYKYNSRGNLIEISYSGIPLASYLWGYNGQYPIVEASDIDYQTLSATARLAGLSSEQIEGRSIMLDSAIKNLAEELRRRLPSSNISAISYHWLLGMARFITPRGNDSSYSYDHQGRLTEIRDFNNYLINKYTYQYAKEESFIY